RTHVHLWLPHPSPALWDALTHASAGAPGAAPGEASPRSEDDAEAAVHPLLRGLGREARELALRLRPLAARAAYCSHEPEDEPPAPTLLHRLQADIRANREPDPAARDRKSTRLNSSHVSISYAVFCLKKKQT